MCRNRYMYFFAHKNIHILCTTHACVCVWTLNTTHVWIFVWICVFECEWRGASLCSISLEHKCFSHNKFAVYNICISLLTMYFYVCGWEGSTICMSPPERILRLHWIWNSEIWCVSHIYCAFFCSHASIFVWMAWVDYIYDYIYVSRTHCRIASHLE